MTAEKKKFVFFFSTQWRGIGGGGRAVDVRLIESS